jgi:hypothetical protein
MFLWQICPIKLRFNKSSRQRKGICFSLFDKGQKNYLQYGTTKTPHVFLLEKN